MDLVTHASLSLETALAASTAAVDRAKELSIKGRGGNSGLSQHSRGSVTNAGNATTLQPDCLRQGVYRSQLRPRYRQLERDPATAVGGGSLGLDEAIPFPGHGRRNADTSG